MISRPTKKQWPNEKYRMIRVYFWEKYGENYAFELIPPCFNPIQSFQKLRLQSKF